jgi:Flp pilus assembly pilin Flp
MRSRGEHGATTVEYALLVALCVVVFMAAIWGFESVTTEVFDKSACDSSKGYSCEKTP